MKKFNKLKTLKLQIKKVKDNEPILFFMFIIYTITAGLFPVVGVIFPKYIINGITEGKTLEDIYLLIGFMGGLLIIFGGLSTFLRELSYVRILRLRIIEFCDYFDYYLNAKYQYMEDPKWQDLSQKSIETLSNDEEGYQGTLKAIFSIFAYIVSVILYIYLITIFNAWILIAILIGSIISILIGKYSKDYRLKRDNELQRQERRFKYFTNITSDFTYTKDIRIYGLKSRILATFNKETILFLRIWQKIKKRQYLLALLDLLAGLIQEGLAYYLLIKAAFNGDITIGEFTMYVSAVLALSTLLRTISTDISNIYEWLGYSTAYFNYINDQDYLLSKGGISPQFTDTLEIEFKSVSFKYPNTENYILKNFNFKINKGIKLAIVGANGAGKSTIVKLITGLFEPTEGEILINGHNIKEYNRHELYKQYSVVFQDINIFAFSIKENVSMKTASQTDERLVMECLKSVGLWEKVAALPNGLDTNMLKIIDAKGIEFSGGENQKLVIARGLYQQGKCIILDEPTAALDALAEADIYQGFNHLVSDKTAIYISHRLASTKFCDYIALFTKEGLAEYGSHDELMAQEGLYYEMFTTQGKYYQEGSRE